MTLKELQNLAWNVAETKGHHENLDKVTVFGRRERALANMMPFYASVTLLTQYIKRHGIEETPEGKMALFSLAGEIASCFDVMMDRLKNDTIHEETLQHLPSLVRLALVHTEVDEAADALHDAFNFGNELADILIRVGDLAESVTVDLDAHTQEIMMKNIQRPYKYGTSEESRQG